MAYVSHEHRFIFFAAPATGSSAIIKALEMANIGEYWPKEHLVKGGKRVTPKKHSTLAQLEAGDLLKPVADYYKVVGVRNVYAWFVARYLRNKTTRQSNIQNKKSWIYDLPDVDRERTIRNLRRQASMSFEEFLTEALGKPQPFDPHNAFHEGMDLYIHQESMDEDFLTFRDKVGLPQSVVVPQFNVTGAMRDGKTYRDFYDEELIERVQQCCKPFFEHFPEYGFDGLQSAD